LQVVRGGRDDSFAERREHVAQGVGDHGGLLIDEELKALDIDELDKACSLLVVAVLRHHVVVDLGGRNWMVDGEEEDDGIERLGPWAFPSF
jgi:hypothetical protein